MCVCVCVCVWRGGGQSLWSHRYHYETTFAVSLVNFLTKGLYPLLHKLMFPHFSQKLFRKYFDYVDKLTLYHNRHFNDIMFCSTYDFLFVAGYHRI